MNFSYLRLNWMENARTVDSTQDLQSFGNSLHSMYYFAIQFNLTCHTSLWISITFSTLCLPCKRHSFLSQNIYIYLSHTQPLWVRHHLNRQNQPVILGIVKTKNNNKYIKLKHIRLQQNTLAAWPNQRQAWLVQKHFTFYLIIIIMKPVHQKHIKKRTIFVSTNKYSTVGNHRVNKNIGVWRW